MCQVGPDVLGGCCRRSLPVGRGGLSLEMTSPPVGGRTDARAPRGSLKILTKSSCALDLKRNPQTPQSLTDTAFDLHKQLRGLLRGLSLTAGLQTPQLAGFGPACGVTAGLLRGLRAFDSGQTRNMFSQLRGRPDKALRGLRGLFGTPTRIRA
jgi:hypothetical protein